MRRKRRRQPEEDIASVKTTYLPMSTAIQLAPRQGILGLRFGDIASWSDVAYDAHHARRVPSKNTRKMATLCLDTSGTGV